MHESRFSYRPSPARGALWTLAAALALALVLPDAGWRLLALFTAAGPTLWLLREALLRRCAVRLAESAVVVEQPVPIFSRRVPYAKLAGAGEHALAYRRPPRQPGLPPRVGLVTFAPLAQEAAFWEALEARWPAGERALPDQVMRWVRARRRRRLLLGGAGLLSTPLAVMLLARLAGFFG